MALLTVGSSHYKTNTPKVLMQALAIHIYAVLMTN